jgi:hypothetical protein
MLTMFGCESLAACCASSVEALHEIASAAKCSRSTLIATRRRNTVSTPE